MVVVSNTCNITIVEVCSWLTFGFLQGLIQSAVTAWDELHESMEGN